MILAANGDWMVYASKCSKEDHRIHDIFIARASDGKWYYSTFHFCIEMYEIRVSEQPSSLANFTEKYCLKVFDGHSDACLESTWPPKSARAETAGSTP